MRASAIFRAGCVLAALHMLASVAARAADQESRADAWFTGPMLAPSPGVLPLGRMLIEPYLFDEISNASFDDAGHRHSGSYEHTLGSQTYILFGVGGGFSAGLIPRFAYNEPAGAANSGSPAIGDVTLQAAYGLSTYTDGSYLPATALVVQETLPTGRYDRLSRGSDGLGSGVYATSLALYSQEYLWMPNGRILRVRLDLTYTLSSSGALRDLSVYGTTNGFSGRVYPGSSWNADASAEYSLSRNWVLALDAVYQGNGTTRVSGRTSLPTVPVALTAAATLVPFMSDSGPSHSIAFAPALEYNFSSAIGVLLGVRIIEIGRNISGTVTPALAVNMVL